MNIFNFNLSGRLLSLNLVLKKVGTRIPEYHRLWYIP